MRRRRGGGGGLRRRRVPGLPVRIFGSVLLFRVRGRRVADGVRRQRWGRGRPAAVVAGRGRRAPHERHKHHRSAGSRDKCADQTTVWECRCRRRGRLQRGTHVVFLGDRSWRGSCCCHAVLLVDKLRVSLINEWEMCATGQEETTQSRIKHKKWFELVPLLDPCGSGRPNGESASPTPILTW